MPPKNIDIPKSEIIPGLQKGDNLALLYLYNEFFSRLVYFADRLISNRQEAEDIVMQIFNKLWYRRDYFDSIINVKAFLYISTRNCCLNYLNKKKRDDKKKQKYANHLKKATDPVSERAQIESEFVGRVYAAIEELPAKNKIVFKLAYFEGCKAKEIAQKLHITVSAVTSHLFRARALLRRSLGDSL